MINQYAVAPSQAGGTRHYDFARELISRGHKVTIIASSFHYISQTESAGTAKGNWKREEVDGVEFVWLPVPAYSGNGARRIVNLLYFALAVCWWSPFKSRSQPDVVIGSSPSPFAALAAERLARRHGVPFILEIRDLWPQSLVDVGRISKLHPFVLALSMLERYLYRHADHIVTLLPDAREDMVKRGANPDTICWLPNGVRLSAPIAPAKSGENNKDLVALYAGAHGRANALDTIIDAARLLRQHGARIRIVLLGDGPEKKRLKLRAKSENVTNIEFRDSVPKSEMFNVMAHADAFIFTLVAAEVFSHGVSANKLFGYMAGARPVIFACGASNNPVAEADCGITVPPEDSGALARSLMQLAALPSSERAAMGQRGRAYVERQHNVEILGKSLEQLLVAILSMKAKISPPACAETSRSAASADIAERASEHSVA